MARMGRYFLPDQPLHVIQRGNDRQPIFFVAEDYAHYRQWLSDAAAHNGCAIHAYVFMTNHVHLLLTPAKASSLPRTMQSLGRRYVRYINFAHRRTGTLWEGRYRAAPIDSEAFSSRAAAISNSIRCVPAWCERRAITRIRVTAPMLWARRILSCRITRAARQIVFTLTPNS